MRREFEEGFVKYNIHGTKMKLLKYLEEKPYILVEFECGYLKKTRVIAFKEGKIRSPKCRTICGIGYLDGETSFHGTKYYNTWKGLIARCNGKDKFYLDCTLDKKWESLSNFKKWFENNYYEIDSETMDLDKDILVKYNRVYGENTCIFVPHSINCLFSGGIDITYTQNDKYMVRGIVDGKRIGLGTYENYNYARSIAIENKERHINNTLLKYKYKIPEKIYKALEYRGRMFILDLIDEI